MTQTGRAWARWLGASLLLGAGCSELNGDGANKSDRPASDAELHASKTALLRADSCDDLLGKVQDDAIAKLDLTVALFKERYSSGSLSGGGDDDSSFGAPVPPSAGPRPTTPTTASPGSVAAPSGEATSGGAATGNAGLPPSAQGSSAGADNAAVDAPERDTGSASTGGGSGSKDPIGASDTNTQVEGVDEADFVKLVDSGKGMFLLHGNMLLKLKTYPAEELSLEPAKLKIEGSPSELFVTDDGRAVIFSSVNGYGGFGGSIGSYDSAVDVCTPSYCGGDYYGGSATKITVADVSGDSLTTLRELYYQGSYLSSRRIGDVVRVVLQGASSYNGLFDPEVNLIDPWHRPYPEQEVFDQIDQWRNRIAASIRNTKLHDWVPVAKEAKDGKLSDVQPDCDSFYVPQPGLADGGLVHVLSLDVSKRDAAVGGVTIMGQAATVYSSTDRLVLAQPDYRWLGDGIGDVGFIDEQRTSLHVFALDKDSTNYLASGWVRGHLPNYNPQFAIDVTGDHALRVVTSGNVRKNPDLTPKDPNFWQTETENIVTVLREAGKELKVAGTSAKLGHPGDTTYSARFVGERAYVVTFRRTDPLYVLDVGSDQPKLLGEIQIPGFSQYMHPLDDDHLITFGDSGNGGSQLQLFDVSDPAHLPPPKLLDFGGGSSSEVANKHQAFTFYAPEKLIALPVTGSRMKDGIYSYLAALRVIRVDADKGFELLGSIDHSEFYTGQSSGCFACGAFGCNNFCPDYGGSSVRRGHFVQNSDTTYVYAIGTAGVSVSDLKTLANTLQKVRLPAVNYDPNSWYGSSQGTPPSATGGGVGKPVVGVGISLPGTTTPAQPPIATPPVANPSTPQDAGAAPTPAVDGGAGTTGQRVSP